MTGIIMMILGLLLLVFGAIIYNSQPQSERPPDTLPEAKIIESKIPDVNRQMEHVIDLAIADGVITKREEDKIRALAIESNMDAEAMIIQAKSKLEATELDAETEVINYTKRNGDDFEKFIVQLFNPDYFNVKEWAGDKYVNGIYADTTLNPDLLMALKIKGQTHTFYVECKWRAAFTAGNVTIARKYQLDRYKKIEEETGIPVFMALGIGGLASKPEFLYVFPVKKAESNKLTEVDLRPYYKEIESRFYFDIKSQVLK